MAILRRTTFLLLLLAGVASAQTTTTSTTLPSGGSGSVLKFSGTGDSGTRAPIAGTCWIGCTAGGTVVIQDGASGNTVWSATCPVTNTTFCWSPTTASAIKATIRVTTLSSGTLYVYLATQ